MSYKLLFFCFCFFCIHVTYWLYCLPGPEEESSGVTSYGDQAEGNQVVLGEIQHIEAHQRAPTSALSTTAQEKLDALQDAISVLVVRYDKEVFMRPKKVRLRNICDRYELEGKQDKVFIPNVWRKYLRTNDERDVVVVTQMHLAKLDVLQRFLEHWDGGFSVTLFLNTSTSWQLPKLLLDNYTSILERHNIDLHLVAMEGVSTLNFF